MANSRCFNIADLSATMSFGRRLGSRLFPGAVVALVGQIGAGKTHLTRAIAEGLKVTNPELITSPTFVLIQEYSAALPIYHFDAYRLTGAAEFDALGASEYLYGRGVCVIEWADKVLPALPEEHLRVQIEVIDESQRKIHITGFGDRYDTLISSL
jgi:tRNA threonylcarbamoyladenosine biosynthesis protein TsaE